MNFLVELISPWLGWIVTGAGAALALLIGMARARSKGKKEGIQQEQARQAAAENKAKDIVHDVKEDVRTIPSTPEGAKQRNERAERWVNR